MTTKHTNSWQLPYRIEPNEEIGFDVWTRYDDTLGSRNNFVVANCQMEEDAIFVQSACNAHYELVNTLNEIAGMAEEGRLTISDIVDDRVGCRQIDSAAAVTRGWFLTIAELAKAALAKAGKGSV